MPYPSPSFWDDRSSESWQAITGGGDIGAEGWYSERFREMVVEVTVTYADWRRTESAQ